MHEYSIVQALIERVDQEARARGARGVVRLDVRVGDAAGVDPRLLVAAFDAFRERAVCAGAALHVVNVPARWECPRCGLVIEPGARLRCPSCAAPARLGAGDEIVLDRIEMEVDHV